MRDEPIRDEVPWPGPAPKFSSERQKRSHEAALKGHDVSHATTELSKSRALYQGMTSVMPKMPFLE
jgi:hypothetical protein